MLPTLRDGDWIFVDHMTPVRAGDVAVIDRNGSIVVHRILSRRLNLEIGDACQRATRFKADELVGRVVAVSRGSRNVDLTNALSRLRDQIWTLRGLGKVGLRKLRGKDRRVVRILGHEGWANGEARTER